MMQHPAVDTRVDEFLWSPLRNPLRWAVASGVGFSALAHFPVAGEHLRHAPYSGVGFIVLIVGCLLIATAALTWDTAAVYALAMVVCGLAVAGYVASRVVALPGHGHDVGNWFQPLGVVAVLAETATAAASVCVLIDRRQRA